MRCPVWVVATLVFPLFLAPAYGGPTGGYAELVRQVGPSVVTVLVEEKREGAAQRAALFGADAVFLSPVFPTASHPGRATLTPVRVRLMAQETRVPLYALGGINAGNAQQLLGARLAGIAAIGALAP